MEFHSPLKLIVGPSKILETPCRPDFFIPKWVIPEMFCLLWKHQGAGLAAPQVGIDARLFVTAWGMVYINPVITWRGERRIRSQESCLSFPDVTAHIMRNLSIEVGGHRYDGGQAIVIQHELDHLNGLHIGMLGKHDLMRARPSQPMVKGIATQAQETEAAQEVPGPEAARSD